AFFISAASFCGPGAAAPSTPNPAGPTVAEAIPWTQLGVVAAAQYSGEGLRVTRTEQGARLRCVIQRLEGEVTCEGLWLMSTVTNNVNDRFRVVAAELAHAVTTTGLPRAGNVTIDGQVVRLIRPGVVEEY